MEVFVRTLTGKAFVIMVRPGDTVESVKRVVETVEGIPWDQQVLVCARCRLEDHRTLAQHGVQQHATLHLMLRPRGD
ncbi:polyubiqutin [Acanthamoeba castellanii str. Neff]|jgi:hypothetical protein|uniref:Polyubiqutin n=1 Tax=Acanthamoeba castellanii (strain ATCC 30010 / Neff) TaxID=1257118 RepID=L8HHH8_ACACF|nr:polyubiqutin [Acanthamoeba castellanii str. Neff]ELR25039.1 polyubiqutin [Acanthamoeba castellanii str. Neff]